MDMATNTYFNDVIRIIKSDKNLIESNTGVLITHNGFNIKFSSILTNDSDFYVGRLDYLKVDVETPISTFVMDSYHSFRLADTNPECIVNIDDNIFSIAIRSNTETWNMVWMTNPNTIVIRSYINGIETSISREFTTLP